MGPVPSSTNFDGIPRVDRGAEATRFGVVTVDPTENELKSETTVEITFSEKQAGIGDLRAAIPSYCFKPSWVLSSFYLLKDLVQAFGLFYLAIIYIPLVPNVYLRAVTYIVYGVVQGFVWMGLWVIGHECGHSAFSSSSAINNTVGFLLHSLMLTPYYAWRSTHARHHTFVGHLDKDTAGVPLRRKDYVQAKGFTDEQLDEAIAEAPIMTIFRIVRQQSVGWLFYLLTSATSGTESSAYKSKGWWNNSHFGGSSFRKDEVPFILLSDLSLVITLGGLYALGKQFGGFNVFLIYGLPYLWINQWIVAIAYLHHTHPTVPKYEPDNWTFYKGALATVDRDFGFVGRYFFHNIIDDHVVHHLFSRIPFYYAPAATAAIKPLLGNRYRKEHGSFIFGLWVGFRNCQWVEVDPQKSDMMSERPMWYSYRPAAMPKTIVLK